MIVQKVTAADRGQRLDKYIKRILPNAGSSFIYKMLRKKNIVLNGARADGRELLNEGDTVTFWFSDETYTKFANSPLEDHDRIYLDAYHKLSDQVQVIYEQGELLFASKPAGVLSQKAKDSDTSLNEWLIGYLLESGQLSGMKERTYTPSVCNRLDRNTGGIVICAKTLLGSRVAAQILRDRSVHKFYQMVVAGRLQDAGTIRCWTMKDPATNIVRVYDREMPGSSATETHYRVLQYNRQRDLTLVEAELVTGKTHQLRVHLAYIGHPILGDPKYGDPKRREPGVHFQLLWSYRLELPQFEEAELADLSGRTILCEPPEIFKRIMN